MPADPARRAPKPVFRPRVALSVLYFGAFFFAFALAFALPDLAEIARSVPPGPEQQQLALEATREAVRPKLPAIAGLALLATGLGIYSGRLPGLGAR